MHNRVASTTEYNHLVENKVKSISSYGWKIMKKQRLIVSGVTKRELDGSPSS